MRLMQSHISSCRLILPLLGRLASLAAMLWAAACLNLAGATLNDQTALGDAPTAAEFSGVECLQKAATVIGKPIDMVALLLSKHLHSENNPAAVELLSIAQEQKLHGQSYANLTMAQLRHASFPVLLHVRGSRYSAHPDRYIVCLDIHGNEARIFNPPDTEKNIPVELLAARWNGEALIVSPAELSSNLETWRYQSYLPKAILAGAALGILTLLWLRRFFPKARAAHKPATLRGSLLQTGGLVTCALALGYGSRMALGQPLGVRATIPYSANDPDPMDLLLQTTLQGESTVPLAEVGTQEALGMHALGALFVDARERSEYRVGHISGALNCPVDEAGRLRLRMAGIPKDRKIAVYCLSSHCGKGHYLAVALKQQGFTDVTVYRDGWVKWSGPKELN